MKGFIGSIYHNRIVEAALHTLVYCLKKELKDCETVLDLGCGPSSPLQYCNNIKYSVGVEIFKPYFEETKSKRIHKEYINADIGTVDFPEKSFDAVMMIEILEHIDKKLAEEMIKKSEKWAKKKVIISTPNGFLSQKIVDNNPHQQHISGFTIDEYKKMGYKVHGMSGLKFLSKEGEVNSLKEKNAAYSNMRFRPKPIFYVLNAFCQIFSYYLSKIAFGLLAVKKIKE